MNEFLWNTALHSTRSNLYKERWVSGHAEAAGHTTVSILEAESRDADGVEWQQTEGWAVSVKEERAPSSFLTGS